MARLDSFLRLVAEQKASDLHFQAGSAPIVRHDGELVPIPFRTPSEQETWRFLEEILIPQERERLENREDLDFIYDLQGVARFRVNIYRHSRGVGAVFRVIPNRTPTLEELELPPSVGDLVNHSDGLVLICGPTGSGKTTTLAALVERINRTQARHVITIEDPIEYVHTPNQSVITQRQIGLHTQSFGMALRAALREAPDVIVVGELRDVETISLALSAAETGVLVFGTLHTNSVAKAIHRVIDAFSDDLQVQTRGLVSLMLRAVVVQHLLKRATGEGRVAATEIMLRTVAMGHAIRDDRMHMIEALLEMAENVRQGMTSLDNSLMRLLRERLIVVEEAAKIANDPERLRKYAEQLDQEM